MKWSRALIPGEYILILLMSCLMFLCQSGQNASIADDALDVKRDADRTVYTVGATDEKNNALDGNRDKERNVYSVGSSKEKKNQEALKEERSWDMLMNMDIWQGNPDYRGSSHKQSSTGQPPKDRPSHNTHNPTQGQPQQKQTTPAQ